MINSSLKKHNYPLHKIGFFCRSTQFFMQDNIRKEGTIQKTFHAIAKASKIFQRNSGFYEYIELPITTRCSLRCKECSNLIPYYQTPYDMDLEKTLQAIDTYLQCIQNVVYFRILGGEPFLSPHLGTILSKTIHSSKIQRIEIVTNGTVLPTDKNLIQLLCHPKVAISISHYSIVSTAKLENMLTQNHIRYSINAMDFWYQYGSPQKQNKSIKELKKQYKKCNHICKSIVNGSFHLCPRSGHATDLGMIQNNEEDYLDLLDQTLSIEDKKEKMKKLYQKDYIMACDYCNYGTSKCQHIPVAEQILQ